MKLRIKDNSVRFRITLKELETLRSEGVLRSETHVLNLDGPGGVFRCALVRDPDAQASRMEWAAEGATMRLASADFQTLANDKEEGVYIRREWTDEDGFRHRFMAFVEKDRPRSVCDKIEEWIYEERLGQKPLTRPIPKGR
jgi:hypothetical protein